MRDGGRDGDRRPDLGFNILNYTFLLKGKPRSRREEVEVLWLVGIKKR
jgi:hypothetical protein